jgi:adsorption protein B
MRSVFFACLLPPILPIRLIWGNIINMTATMKAYKQKLFGTNKHSEKGRAKSEPEKKKIAWDKTDHVFLEKQALRRYHRTIGDVLLEKGYVTTDQLMEALQNTREKQQTTGNYLMRKNIIDEAQLLDALAHIKHTQYVEEAALEAYRLNQFSAEFDEKQLRALKALPLLRTKSGYVFAFCDTSPQNAQTIIRERYGYPIGAVLATQKLIGKGLDMIYGQNRKPIFKFSVLTEAYENNLINYEQLIIARNLAAVHRQMSEVEILQYMGLRPDYMDAILAEVGK